jgi:hypothetical protein
MLTNTLLLYVTQEAWAKARARFTTDKPGASHDEITAPGWLKAADQATQVPSQRQMHPRQTQH